MDQISLTQDSFDRSQQHRERWRPQLRSSHLRPEGGLSGLALAFGVWRGRRAVRPKLGEQSGCASGHRLRYVRQLIKRARHSPSPRVTALDHVGRNDSTRVFRRIHSETDGGPQGLRGDYSTINLIRHAAHELGLRDDDHIAVHDALLSQRGHIERGKDLNAVAERLRRREQVGLKFCIAFGQALLRPAKDFNQAVGDCCNGHRLVCLTIEGVVLGSPVDEQGNQGRRASSDGADAVPIDLGRSAKVDRPDGEYSAKVDRPDVHGAANNVIPRRPLLRGLTP